MSKLPVIIGLRGPMGCGKDTSALFIKECAPKYEIRRFSYGLRVAASILTNIPIEKTWSDAEKCQQLNLTFTQKDFILIVEKLILAIYQPEQKLDYEFIACKFAIILANSDVHIKMTLGELLQKLGTECLRDVIDKDIFVKYLNQNWDQKTPIIITDVRNVNELEFVHSHKGLVVEIVRPDASRKDGRDTKHYSEVALNGIKSDVYLQNDGTLEELQKKLLHFLKTFFH